MQRLTLVALALAAPLTACREEVSLGAWDSAQASGGGGSSTATEGGLGQGGDIGTSAGDVGLPACLESEVSGPLNEPGQSLGTTETATDWTWPAPVTSMEWDLMVEREIERPSAAAPPTNGYYWAYQFSFLEGIVGYLGIQAEGGYQLTLSDPPVFTKIAVFWLSGPPLAAELGDIAYPNARVAPQSARGVEYTTIHARFDWQACTTYRLRVAPAAMEADGSTWYGAWIEDTTSGNDVFLGRMLLPAGSGLLAPYSISRTLPIEFQEPTSCVVPAHASALFGRPRAGDEGVHALLEANRFGVPWRCPTSRFTEFETAVRHELDVPP